MTVLARPACLHIHDLWEGEATRISWSKVDGAVEYVLERLIDQTFEEAMTGRIWADLDIERKSWSQFESLQLDWEGFEALLDLSRLWENASPQSLTWEQMEAKYENWEQWALEPLGLGVYQGPGTEEQGCTWMEFEDGDMTWDAVVSGYDSWDQLESVMLHRSVMDAIPIGAKEAVHLLLRPHRPLLQSTLYEAF